MKVLLLAALCALLASTIADIPEMDCPPEDDPEHDVLYPNPDNCTTFYECAKGSPVLMLCPPGLHYNPEMQYCDYPELANCSAVVTVALPTCPPPGGDPGNIILHPNPANCSQYYECDNGVLKPHDCPPGLHFNAALEVCDFIWAANCTETALKVKVVPVVAVLPVDLPTCPPPGGDPGNIILHPNPANCSQYYECDNGVLKPHDCPPGLHFNAKDEVCDFPWAANCTETSLKVKVVPVVEVLPVDLPTCPPPGGDPGNIILHPNPANCSQYYECDNGVLKPHDCPPGLHFNAKAEVCDFPWAANCTETSLKVKVVPVVEVLPVDLPTCPPPGGDPGNIILHPNPANCSQYYECDNGVLKPHDCPPGLHFNAKAEVCDFPWAANCTETSLKVKAVPVVEVLPVDLPTCPPPGGDPGNIILHPNPANCSQYYECDNGVLKPHDCPPGLHFNAKDEVCDFPWAANCTETPIKGEVDPVVDKQLHSKLMAVLEIVFKKFEELKAAAKSKGSI